MNRNSSLAQKQGNERAFRYYLILAGMFIAALVGCNLIFQKFFYWTPFQLLCLDCEPDSIWYNFTNYTFEISVGIIAYPVTFLITDLISEIFGRKRANQVVVAGLISAVFIYLLVSLAIAAPATLWSPVSQTEFARVFGLTGPAVFASMMAYLFAQFIDIRIFHFWKRVTKGKMLWLRNNFSTIPSQLVDTAVVLILLCSFDAIAWDRFWGLFLNGFLFKVMFAAFDTPLFYLGVYLSRRFLGLKENEEIHFG